MVIAVVVAGVLVVALVAAAALRRQGGGEAHSVEGYKHTLETLQDMRTRSGGGVRILSGPESGPSSGEAGDAPAGVAAAPGPEAAGEGDRDQSGRLVFGEPVPTAPPPDRGTPRQRDRAMSAMNHRPRRLAGPVAVVVVVAVLVIVLAVAGAHSRSGPKNASHHGHTTRTTVAHGHAPGTTVPGHTTSTTRAPSTTTTRPRTTTTTRPRPTTTTTTTLPARFTPEAGWTPTGATYPAPATRYRLTVTSASGDCWVDITGTAAPAGKAGTTSTTSTTAPNSGSAAVVYTGTVNAQSSRSVTVVGATSVELGALNDVGVTLNGRPVIVPPGAQAPFTLQFQPVP